MNIALPILLLVFGGLSLWVLTESKLKWYFKATCITTFCIFTIIFWSSIHSFLGWPANESEMPKKMLVHWVIIKEPNKFTKSDGAIYILGESAEEKKTNKFLKFFEYKKNRIEPRLYRLPYDRGLHEQLENAVIPELKKGQPVLGGFSKAKGRDGKSKKNNKGGDGSESQEQGWEFHSLRPSDFLYKPAQ